MKSFFGLMGSNRNGKARLYSGLHPRIPLIEVFSPQTRVEGRRMDADASLRSAYAGLSLTWLSRPSELHDWVLVRPLTATGRAFRLSRLRMTFNRHVFERVEH